MLFDANGQIIQQPDIHDPQGVSPADAALLGRLVAEVRALENTPLFLELSPLVVVQLAGLVQLALRHDGTMADIRDTALGFLEGVREYFADAPAILEVLRRGDDPTQDAPT